MRIAFRSMLRRILVSVVAVLTVTLSPVTVGAVDGSTTTTPENTRLATALCERITKFQDNHATKITTTIGSLKSKFDERLATITERHAEIDKKITASRKESIDNFNQRIDALLAAETRSDQQKAAIDTFKSNMLAAETLRENTVDDARQSYRASLLQKITGYQDAAIQSLTSLQLTIQTALETSQANCTSETALTTLRSTIATARQSFTPLHNLSTTKEDIKQLINDKQATVKTANDNFKQSANEYTSTLKEALKTEQP